MGAPDPNRNLKLRLSASNIKDAKTSDVSTQRPLAVAIKPRGLQNRKGWETEG